MKWAFRAWIPRKEHRAQERLTWKADALPTELLPLVSLTLLGQATRKESREPNKPRVNVAREPPESPTRLSTTLVERITVADSADFTLDDSV